MKNNVSIRQKWIILRENLSNICVDGKAVAEEDDVTCLSRVGQSRTWISHASSLCYTSHATSPKSYMPKLPTFAYPVGLIKSGYFSVSIGVSVA